MDQNKDEKDIVNIKEMHNNNNVHFIVEFIEGRLQNIIRNEGIIKNMKL